MKGSLPPAEQMLKPSLRASVPLHRGCGRRRRQLTLPVSASGNTFGHSFRVTTFGESHGKGVGCVIDGVPPRLPITKQEIQVLLLLDGRVARSLPFLEDCRATRSLQCSSPHSCACRQSWIDDAPGRAGLPLHAKSQTHVKYTRVILLRLTCSVGAFTDHHADTESAFASKPFALRRPSYHAGVGDGITLGTPICIMVPNTDQKSQDYTEMAVAYRPSHADATYDMKYGIRAVSASAQRHIQVGILLGESCKGRQSDAHPCAGCWRRQVFSERDYWARGSRRRCQEAPGDSGRRGGDLLPEPLLPWLMPVPCSLSAGRAHHDPQCGLFTYAGVGLCEQGEGCNFRCRPPNFHAGGCRVK